MRIRKVEPRPKLPPAKTKVPPLPRIVVSTKPHTSDIYIEEEYGECAIRPPDPQVLRGRSVRFHNLMSKAVSVQLSSSELQPRSFTLSGKYVSQDVSVLNGNKGGGPTTCAIDRFWNGQPCKGHGGGPEMGIDDP